MLSNILVLRSRTKSNAWTTRSQVFHLLTSQPGCCHSKKEALKVFLTQCLNLSLTGFGHMKAAAIKRMTTTKVSLKSRTVLARLAAFNSFFSSFIRFLVFFLFMLHCYVFQRTKCSNHINPIGPEDISTNIIETYGRSHKAFERPMPLGFHSPTINTTVAGRAKNLYLPIKT